MGGSGESAGGGPGRGGRDAGFTLSAQGTGLGRAVNTAPRPSGEESAMVPPLPVLLWSLPDTPFAARLPGGRGLPGWAPSPERPGVHATAQPLQLQSPPPSRHPPRGWERNFPESYHRQQDCVCSSLSPTTWLPRQLRLPSHSRSRGWSPARGKGPAAACASRGGAGPRSAGKPGPVISRPGSAAPGSQGASAPELRDNAAGLPCGVKC